MQGALQLSLFDEQDLVQTSSRSFPASGWCAATTPCWPRSGPAKRGELLAATEKELAPIAAATGRDNNARCAARTRSRCGWAR